MRTTSQQCAPPEDAPLHLHHFARFDTDWNAARKLANTSGLEVVEGCSCVCCLLVLEPFMSRDSLRQGPQENLVLSRLYSV